MMSIERHYRMLERMYLNAPVNVYYAPEIHINEGQAANAVHGAVYFKLLDDSSFFAANSLVEDVFVLTVSYNVYFTRPVSEGIMKATGKVVQASPRLIIAESVVVDSGEREIARGSGTFMRSKIKLTEEIGYK
jgi:uncharacterized protein (TIGR00369 family)